MNYWIFKADPEQYDLLNSDLLISETADDGITATWYATQYRLRMEPGDIVFFWIGEQNIADGSLEETRTGIYGWGMIVSKPYEKKNLDTFGVDLKYKRRLTSIISIAALKQLPVFSGFLLFYAKDFTNFLLAPQEAEAIIRAMSPDDRPDVGLVSV